MDGPVNPLAHLSEQVRKASDEMANPDAVIESARRRALLTWKADRPVARWPFALAATSVAVALLAFFLLRRPALTYIVGTESEPRDIGTWISAEQDAAPLRFSEGTVLTLSHGSHARVTHANADGASVLLERGSLHAHVVHANTSTQWSIHAGPFELVVVGTEFDLAWDPLIEQLDVTLIEGQVVVRGPLLDKTRPLTSGERLHVNVPQQRFELLKTIASNTTADGDTPAPMNTAPPASSACPVATCLPDAIVAPQGPAAAASAQSAASNWQALAASGRHREAMEAVNREGFSQVLQSASASALLQLADAARYSGDYRRSKEALLQARRRGARGRSAFLLGKLGADHLGATQDAIQWFQTYLTEQPGGGLAEQAYGRLIELRKRSGDIEGARSTAQTYLKRFPGGAYASLAKATVK